MLLDEASSFSRQARIECGRFNGLSFTKGSKVDFDDDDEEEESKDDDSFS